MKKNSKREIASYYLELINAQYNRGLKLTSYNGYYHIVEEMTTGGQHSILTGATLGQCKEWAISVFELLSTKKY